MSSWILVPDAAWKRAEWGGHQAGLAYSMGVGVAEWLTYSMGGGWGRVADIQHVLNHLLRRGNQTSACSGRGGQQQDGGTNRHHACTEQSSQILHLSAPASCFCPQMDLNLYPRTKDNMISLLHSLVALIWFEYCSRMRTTSMAAGVFLLVSELHGLGDSFDLKLSKSRVELRLGRRGA